MAFSITGAITGIHYDWLTGVGHFIDNPVVFALIIISLGLLLEREKNARMRLLAALLLTFLAATALKMVFEIQRPCAAGLDSCPTDFSLPSTHAAVAFTLMFALLEKRVFPAGLVFALFVGFTRINIGVHTFEDVAAGLPLAFISVFLVERLCERWKFCQKS
jgi:membrane-associated phospholipid phosphatase